MTGINSEDEHDVKQAPDKQTGVDDGQTATASIGELVLMFLRLGAVAFGGPVAHIAMMEKEIVQKRNWVGRQHFLDLMAVTNLVPGPNSTQMTMHVGYVQRQDHGTWLAGLSFIFPAFLITLTISWFYVAFGTLPAAEAVLYGIKPVVVALIANALWRLVPKAIVDIQTGIIFACGLVFGLLGMNELLIMFLGALAGLILFSDWLQGEKGAMLSILSPAVLALPGRLSDAVSTAARPLLLRIALLFLRFGATLYGSGYLLIAFIRNDLVSRLGWLTSEQLLDAVAIGQMTPGPVLTTSTAAGYIIAGWPGAAVATAAIFLPSFFLVMIIGRWMAALRNSKTARAILRGVTAAVVAVMLTVTLSLTVEAFVDLFTAALGVGALVAMVRYDTDALMLIGAGGILGYLWVVLL